MVFSPQSCSPFDSFQILSNLAPSQLHIFPLVSHLPLLFYLSTLFSDYFCLPVSVLVSVSQFFYVLPTPYQIKTYLVKFPLSATSLLWSLAQFHIYSEILSSLRICGTICVVTICGRLYVYLASYVRNTASLVDHSPLALAIFFIPLPRDL